MDETRPFAGAPDPNDPWRDLDPHRQGDGPATGVSDSPLTAATGDGNGHGDGNGFASATSVVGDSGFARANGNGHGAPDGLLTVMGAIPQLQTRVELIGTHLRAEGAVDLGHFRRLSDYVNLLEGFFTIHDVVLLSRLGEPTRITFPDLRVRLDDIAIVGQRAPDVPGPSEDFYIPKQRRRLVITTAAHIVYGYAYIHEQASTIAFLDSTDPHFVPMTNVRVRWLADRRLAGRFGFALIQRPHIIGVATEVSGGLSLLTGRHREPASVAASNGEWGEG